jgi:hypothetical protein
MVASGEAPQAGSWREHLLDYGWVHVLIAGVAMAATYPGRMIGVGMITEPMVADLGLQIERVLFVFMNLRATLLGAFFCIPVGRWLDRYGSRAVLPVNFLAWDKVRCPSGPAAATNRESLFPGTPRA